TAGPRLCRAHRLPRSGLQFSPLTTPDDPAPVAACLGPGWSPSHPIQLAIGSMFARRYRVLRKLGGGGQGVVYLAQDTEHDHNVALKIPRFDPSEGPEPLDRFMREAKVAARLDHPNICPVYLVGRFDGISYLPMMYIP